LNKNEKFSRNFSDDGRDNLGNNTEEKLINITNLHKESNIFEDFIFESQILLKILIDEVKFFREEQKAADYKRIGSFPYYYQFNTFLLFCQTIGGSTVNE
jgi:hypothetical protein